MDPRDAVGFLLSKKMDKRAIYKAAMCESPVIRKAEPSKPGIYEVKYQKYTCPKCGKVYEARNDIPPSSIKCQICGVPMQGYTEAPASDGQDIEKPKHAAVDATKKVAKVAMPKDIKFPDAFELGAQSQPMSRVGAMEFISKQWGKNGGEGASFMKGLISASKLTS